MLGKKARNEYIEIARELCYPEECIKKLEKATDEYEADRILYDYRHKLAEREHK